MLAGQCTLTARVYKGAQMQLEDSRHITLSAHCGLLTKLETLPDTSYNVKAGELPAQIRYSMVHSLTKHCACWQKDAGIQGV